MITQVPFVPNPDDRSVPATVGMVLAHFMSEQRFTMPELEKLCAYQRGRGNWPIEHMLRLAEMGFEVKWIENFDLARFAMNPDGYLREIIKDKDVLLWQLQHSNLAFEAARARRYLSKRLPFEDRKATFDDIRQLLDDGWLVRLEVNAFAISGKQGYDPHSILVVGYDDRGVVIHNPDGSDGLASNHANQPVSWELLDRAWREYGGSYSLYAFRKGVA